MGLWTTTDLQRGRHAVASQRVCRRLGCHAGLAHTYGQQAKVKLSATCSDHITLLLLPQGEARRELDNLQQRLEHVEAEYKEAAAAAEQLQQATAQVFASMYH